MEIKLKIEDLLLFTHSETMGLIYSGAITMGQLIAMQNDYNRRMAFRDLYPNFPEEKEFGPMVDRVLKDMERSSN